MRLEIDPHAGFCFGVSRAIDMAAEYLDEGINLYSLGDIVHNQEEIQRLENKGMQTLQHDSMEKARGKPVLIRAHGEPPETFVKANENQFQILDATCPIVIKLQHRVKKAYEEMTKLNGQVLIIGNRKHPEVIGLNGQTRHSALIIEKKEDLDKIDYKKPIRLFAQTTITPSRYEEIIEKIEDNINETTGSTSDYNFRKSLCRYVSGRIPKLREFCTANDIIIFISGKNSSNGKALFNICKSHNPRSYFISKPEEFDEQWINNAKSIGISGATSTPDWLMKNLAEKIKTKVACT